MFRVRAHGRIEITPEPAANRHDIEWEYYGTILAIAAHIRGFESLHASGIYGPRGVVAFSGPSRSGKSTTAHGLVSRGRLRWADDCIAVRVTSQGIWSVALPYVVNLRGNSATSVGALSVVTDTPRIEVERIGDEASLAAIVLLAPNTGKTGLERIDPGVALREMLANAYRFPPLGAQRQRTTVTRFLDLATRIPVYRLVSGHRPDEFGSLLDELEGFIDGL